LLGQPDENALGAPGVAEPIHVFVLDHFVDELRAVSAEPGERIVEVFIPLLTAWLIWIGIAISTRASDVRVAQQFAVLGSLPPVAVTSLMGFGVIKPTLTLAVILAAALLAIDLAGWRLVATLFNRERLITGSTPTRAADTA
jgi:hypothetical protein